MLKPNMRPIFVALSLHTRRVFELTGTHKLLLYAAVIVLSDESRNIALEENKYQSTSLH